MKWSQPGIRRFFIALLLPFVACGLQFMLWPAISPHVWPVFIPAAFFSSRIGGKAAGLLSAVISAILAVYFFIPPQFTLLGKGSSHLSSVAVFLFMGGLFSFINARLERDKTRMLDALNASRLAEEQLQEARISLFQAERKLAEESLRETEHRFRSIFNGSPIAIGIGRRSDGRVVEVNDAWLQLFGFERDDVVGRTTSELKLYDRADEREELIELINERGKIVNREVVLRRKTDDAIVVLYSAEIIKLGEEQCLQVLLTDITPQKRNEIAREATVELLRICNVVDTLPELMRDLMSYFQKLTSCESVGVRLREGNDFPYYMTRGFSEDFVLEEKYLCAYDQEGELIRDYAGHPALDCMCGNILCNRFDSSQSFFTDHGSFWSSCTSELLATATDADRQVKTRNRCNGEGYESVALIPLRHRNQTYGLFQFNDREKGRFTAENIGLYEELVDYVSITLSKLKVDEALRENEERLRRAEGMAHFGHWRYELGTERITWSDELYRIFGFGREARVCGPTVEEIRKYCHPEDLEHCARSFMLHDREDDGTLTYRIIRPNGDERHVVSRGEIERNETGLPVALFGTVQDTTEVKQKERDLQEKNAELERFTYMISHDLKSPLITVRSFLGFLEQDLSTGNAERIEKDIQYIHTAAGNMEQMLNELLEFSRIGRMPNPPSNNTFRDLAEAALSMVAGRVAERGISVLIGDAEVALHGDRYRLIEVWQNLLDNSCKFLGNQDHPLIEIGTEIRGEETVFFVRDNGMGIAPQYQGKIFGLFEKLDRQSEGTGLGLALVKRIVELYKGKIWVESQGTGQGACFRFTLPEAVIPAVMDTRG